jgi:Flp pilus assembly secretin CpaC
MIVASLLLTTAAFAQPEFHVTEGFVRQIDTTGEPIGSVSIGDTSVADALPLTDHSFLVQSHKIGTTNMLMLDKNKRVLDEIVVIVDRPISGVVHIHNKALINSYTEYSCAPNGCQYLGENTVSEPAPLPRGHHQEHFQGDYNMTGGKWITPPSPATVEPTQ